MLLDFPTKLYYGVDGRAGEEADPGPSAQGRYAQ